MKKRSKSVHITDVSISSDVKVNKPLSISISGNLSDAGWKVNEPKVDVNVSDKVLTIRVTGTRDPTIMAAQVITPFNTFVETNFPETGEWKIECNNMTRTIDVINEE